MDKHTLSRIERRNYIIGGILIAAAALLGTKEQAYGMLAGVMVSALNFTAIRVLVSKLVDAPDGPDRARAQARVATLFVPKMGAVMALVVILLYFLPISPLAFAAGFSVFLASIAFEAARYSFSGGTGDAGDGETQTESVK